MTPPRILLCDHRGAGLQDRAPALAARGLDVDVSQSLRRTLERLAERRPEVVVLDPLSPAGRVELEAVDRARAGDPPVPLLVVADPRSGLDVLTTARHLRGGPWDLVWRDASAEELLLRIERLEGVGRLLDEVDELRHRAFHDDKTDLLRPQAFQARLAEHVSAARRHRLDLALVLIDLDRFGRINKDYDHTVGDELIGRVGDAIRGALRTEDVAGRLGGDEFAVLLPYTRKLDAARVVNRLRDRIRACSFTPPGAREEIRVTASLGFETTDGSDDVASVDDLRLHAERAMRAAKVRGGDRGLYYRTLVADRRADPDEGRGGPRKLEEAGEA